MIPSIEFYNGVKMPMIGFGTYKVPDGEVVIDAVKGALSAGYRLIDTAWFYHNEQGVGEAIRQSGIPRDDLFITSKLWNAHHGYDNALRMYDESLKAIGVDALDLYLIHWPGKDKFVETWRAFERLYKEGRVRAIGISNFLAHHLKTLADNCELRPMLDQIEINPRLFRHDTINYCRENGIAVQAWSPLHRGGELLEDPTITDIARAHNKSSAQAILRWEIQHDICVLPKSVTPARIVENLNIFDFELTPGEMSRIDALNINKGVGSDPDTMALDFD